LLKSLALSLLTLVYLDCVENTLSSAVYTVERMTRGLKRMRIASACKQSFFSPSDNTIHLLQPKAVASKLLIIFNCWLDITRIIV